MSALWTVTVLLAVLALADSVAVIALARQVGLLHLQMDSQHRRPPRGPQPGSRLRLAAPLGSLGLEPAPELVLLGFVRPSCPACTAALPAFADVSAGLPRNEKVLLVSDADTTAAQDYLTANDISLPLVTGPHLVSANGIPAVPYAVVTDAAGTVLAAQTAGRAEELQAMLSQARRSWQEATRPVIRIPEPVPDTTGPLPGGQAKEERYVV